MKLECDFTEDELALVCNILMNTALNCFDTAQEIENKEIKSDDENKCMLKLYKMSKDITILSQKILDDLGDKDGV